MLQKMVLFWSPISGHKTGTQTVSPDCRGSQFAFQILARIVGANLVPHLVSIWFQNTALIIALFVDTKQRPVDEWKRKCGQPLYSSVYCATWAMHNVVVGTGFDLYCWANTHRINHCHGWSKVFPHSINYVFVLCLKFDSSLYKHVLILCVGL